MKLRTSSSQSQSCQRSQLSRTQRSQSQSHSSQRIRASQQLQSNAGTPEQSEQTFRVSEQRQSSGAAICSFRARRAKLRASEHSNSFRATSGLQSSQSRHLESRSSAKASEQLQGSGAAPELRSSFRISKQLFAVAEHAERSSEHQSRQSRQNRQSESFRATAELRSNARAPEQR